MTSNQPENIQILGEAQQRFKTQLTKITAQIQNRSLDGGLEDWLNEHMGLTSPIYSELKKSCEIGVAQGWLAAHPWCSKCEDRISRDVARGNYSSAYSSGVGAGPESNSE